MTDISGIVDYYINLLIIQYHELEKARGTVGAYVKQSLCSGLAFDVRDGYNVETAVGHQLDILGKYEDVNRFYVGDSLDGYFAFTTYSEITPDTKKRGFQQYAAFPNNQGKWLQYSSILSGTYVLNDDDFRKLLKLRILQNNINHSHKEIDDAIFEIFGSEIRADSPGDMVMYYFAPAVFSTVLTVALQKHILPKPLAVRLNWIISGDSPFFGFATYSQVPTLNTGFANYSNYDTKIGDTLQYSNLVN